MSMKLRDFLRCRDCESPQCGDSSMKSSVDLEVWCSSFIIGPWLFFLLHDVLSMILAPSLLFHLYYCHFRDLWYRYDTYIINATIFYIFKH